MPTPLFAVIGVLLLAAWTRLPLLQVAWPGQGRTYAQLITQGQAAYARGDYQGASQFYEQAAQIGNARGGQADPALDLNLAHAHYRAGEYLKAAQGYTVLTHSEDPALASMAHNQLAAIALKLGNYDQALDELKTALRLDPNNQTARLNYERVLFGKRPPPPEQKPQPKQGQKPQQNQQPQNQPQNPQQNPQQQNQEQQQKQQGQGQDGQNQPLRQQPQPSPSGQDGGQGNENQNPPGQMRRPDNPDGQGQEGNVRRRRGQTGGQVLEDSQQNDNRDDPNSPADPRVDPDGRPATRAQAKQLRLPPEQARQILEAMKSSETQYLQQRRLRSRRPPSPGQPDW